MPALTQSHPSATPAGTFSFVLEHPPANAKTAFTHFAGRLAVETDPADVKVDLERRVGGFLVADVRQEEHYAECHVAGSINLPYRTISEETLTRFSQDTVFVVYCWSPGCNAATKAARRLGELGFRVKEMIGGIEYWKRFGYPVEGSSA